MRRNEANELLEDFDFPVADYLADHILQARTITRTGAWWSAALLISDPLTKKRYVAFYRWQKRKGSWKRVKKFTCNSRADASVMVSFLQAVSPELD